MKCIYFVEKDGVRKYKCDTFWTLSTDIRNAKIHTIDRDFFNGYCGYIRISCSSEGSNLEEKRDRFIGTIFGYSTFDDDQLENPYRLKKEANISGSKFLRIITGISNKYEVISEDYRFIERDRKINGIIE